jgi:molybdopterin-containing oxidoreductase family iron-sulfur binding subunit
LGATNVFEQAWVLSLYDPLRARAYRGGGELRPWDRVVAGLRTVDSDGKGLRFLLEPTGSPTRIALMEEVRRRYPEARFTFHAPGSPAAGQHAAVRLFGQPLRTIYDFTQSKRIVLLDADPFASMPLHLRYARQFADLRRVRSLADEMPRVYVAEPKPTPSSSLADDRIACQARFMGAIAAIILGNSGDSAAAVGMPRELRDLLEQLSCPEPLRAWAQHVARDLRRYPRESVVVVGERQPWHVHALGLLINAALGSIGRTVSLVPPVLYSGDDSEQAIEALVDELHAGNVETLVIDGYNPVYTLPAELGFEAALRAVKSSFYLAAHDDETAAAATWLVPKLHGLESWGDARSYDGTVSFIQPLISPLYEGKTCDQLLAVLLDEPRKTSHQLVRAHWRRPSPWLDAKDMDAFEAALRRGFLPQSTLASITAEPTPGGLVTDLRRSLEQLPDEGIEVDFFTDPGVYDGRFATNGWLQELPEPITKLTWGNAVIMAPSLMDDLGLRDGQMVAIELEGRAVSGPALAVPDVADRTVCLHLGYGRRSLAGTGYEIGFDATPLKDRSDAAFITGAKIVPRLGIEPLARTQQHFDPHERPIAEHATLHHLKEHPEFVAHLRGPVDHLFLPDQEQASPQWGMAIDMTVCTGCSACVIACQAENNVPVVGKQGVLNGREMHWLRIDRYRSRSYDVVNQPMLCQHCVRAPCEYVCPVNATVHSPDGLNEMIYNRCVGTRFCSNNCPYKVRRFNWFDYVREGPESMQRNPNVTVRERGVMEKCTYCVQRIRRAQIKAEIEGAPFRTVSMETACQQACPTRAITFGDVTDPGTEVRRWWDRPHMYEVLHETGAEPRTKYLAKITNPHDGDD